MTPKILLSLAAFVLLSVTAFSQADSKNIQEFAAADQVQEAQTFVIHVDISSDARKYFPKLYPIGYIIKQTDEEKNMTKYLLGDFSSREEASKALVTVKNSGYNNAFIVKSEEVLGSLEEGK